MQSNPVKVQSNASVRQLESSHTKNSRTDNDTLYDVRAEIASTCTIQPKETKSVLFKICFPKSTLFLDTKVMVEKGRVYKHTNVPLCQVKKQNPRIICLSEVAKEYFLFLNMYNDTDKPESLARSSAFVQVCINPGQIRIQPYTISFDSFMPGTCLVFDAYPTKNKVHLKETESSTICYRINNESAKNIYSEDN